MSIIPNTLFSHQELTDLRNALDAALGDAYYYLKYYRKDAEEDGMVKNYKTQIDRWEKLYVRIDGWIPHTVGTHEGE